MLKKLMFTTLLSTSLYANAQADKNISYSYFEVGYDYLDLDQGSADGLYLNASFNLGESFYLGGYFDDDNLNGRDINQYGLFLGFHNSISDRTDFYSELKVGEWDNGIAKSNTYGLDLGTRTAFTEKIELITKLGYTQFHNSSEGFFNVGVKSLFKFNESNAITVGVENLDGDAFGTSIGYRYTF
jgi:hypothetical protein